MVTGDYVNGLTTSTGRYWSLGDAPVDEMNST